MLSRTFLRASKNKIRAESPCNRPSSWLNSVSAFNFNQANSHRYLATSSLNHGAFDKLKANLAKQQGKENSALEEARRKMAEKQAANAQQFDKYNEKFKKIGESSQSQLHKKVDELKKTVENMSENENYKKFKERYQNSSAAKAAQKLKFKMPDIEGLDNQGLKELKETAAAAEAMGSSIFGILDIDPAYNRPKELRFRKTEWNQADFDIDEETTDTQIHSSTFWEERVNKFKNTKVGQRFDSFSARMEDHDSALIRNAYGFGWRLKESLRMSGEASEAISYITGLDKTFTIAQFCEDLRLDIIPNILEAACQGDEEIIDDWCVESAQAVLLANKKMAAKEGLSYQRHIYSLQSVEFMDASLDEESDSPTIMVSAETQEMVALIDKQGKVIDGSTEKPMKNTNIFVFGRDMNEIDTKACWRLLEYQSSGAKMTF